MFLRVLFQSLTLFQIISLLNEETDSFITHPIDIKTTLTDINLTATSDCVEIEIQDHNFLKEWSFALSESSQIPDYQSYQESQADTPEDLLSQSYFRRLDQTSTIICGLQNNTTYFVYFWHHSQNGEISFQAIHTKPAGLSSYPTSETLPLYLSLGSALLLLIIYGLRSLLLRLNNKGTLQYKKEIELEETLCCTRATDEEKLKSMIENATSLIAKSQIDEVSLVEIRATCKILQEKNYEYEERRMCGVCCERPREVVFLNCGHVYTCGDCARNLSVCPIDKRYISSKFRYRLSDKHGISDNFLPELLKVDPLSFLFTTISPLVSSTILNEKTIISDFTLVKEQHYNYNYFYKCIECNQRMKNVLFKSCCHIVCCLKCSNQLEKCPIDNVPITERLEVYFS